jgi:hypothetical protein
MNYDVFSREGFARVIRAGDSGRFDVDLKANREAIVDAAVQSSISCSVDFKTHFQTLIRTKPCISITDYNANLVLRSLAHLLVRRFRVKIPARDEIVAGVIETLTDSTSMTIVRRDIFSFYESVPTSAIKERLLFSSVLPAISRYYIGAYFETFCSDSKYGLPRGVGLSSILVEMLMEGFDKHVRELDGVYRYFRFSDDIVVFCFRNGITVAERIEDLLFKLSPSLVFNKDKYTDLYVNNKNRKCQKTVKFEYLGYNFSFSDYCGDSHPRQITVLISDKKIVRTKSRIVLSYKSFMRRPNFPLLLDRVKFLSGNYKVLRSGNSQAKDSRSVKSGIYYSYRQCGLYRQGNKHPSPCSELKMLDAFYQSILAGRLGKISTGLLGILTLTQISTLREISFVKGYELPFHVRFSPERVQEIKEAWRHA